MPETRPRGLAPAGFSFVLTVATPYDSVRPDIHATQRLMSMEEPARIPVVRRGLGSMILRTAHDENDRPYKVGPLIDLLHAHRRVEEILELDPGAGSDELDVERALRDRLKGAVDLLLGWLMSAGLIDSEDAEALKKVGTLEEPS